MTVSAPVRDLLQLALGSFPRSQEERDRSRALLRCAYRGRTRKVRLSIVENCGGPGSERPGPCPTNSSIPNSVKRIAFLLRKALANRCNDTTGQCLTAVAALKDAVPDVDIYSGIYRGSKGKGGHYIAKIGEWFIDVTSDQFGDAPIRVFHEGKLPKAYRKGSFSKTTSSDGLFDEESYRLRSQISGSLKRKLKLTSNFQPIKTDIRIKELAPYLHDLLGDVTKRDAKAVARIVKRGVERHWKDSSVARAITRSTKIEPERARVIARTEMARARTDVGLGKKRDSEKVVFTLGEADKTCPTCRALEGKVYTVRKAAGVIPVHPNCRCFWSDAPKGSRVSNDSTTAAIPSLQERTR